jgi:hypothetical protein
MEPSGINEVEKFWTGGQTATKKKKEKNLVRLSL